MSMVKKMPVNVPWPVVVMKEGKWYVASCPPLGIATQGKTLEELKENMSELIVEYLNDPDTPKPDIQIIRSVRMTKVSVPRGASIGRRTPAPATQGH